MTIYTPDKHLQGGVSYSKGSLYIGSSKTTITLRVRTISVCANVYWGWDRRIYTRMESAERERDVFRHDGPTLPEDVEAIQEVIEAITFEGGERTLERIMRDMMEEDAPYTYGDVCQVLVDHEARYIYLINISDLEAEWAIEQRHPGDLSLEEIAMRLHIHIEESSS